MFKESGGRRKGSGRKKLPDVKEQLYIGVKQSIIDLLGEDEVKRLMTEAVVWNGQINIDENILLINLDAEMKVARLSYNGEGVELVEILWQDNKAYVAYNGRRYYISQFGRVGI